MPQQLSIDAVSGNTAHYQLPIDAVNENTAYQQLSIAQEKYSIHEISKFLGLHTGTVKRWVISRRVPIDYLDDLCRLIGRPKQSVGKDQFYTKPEVAEHCWAELQQHLSSLGINEKEYTYIEPAAGCGHFYQVLPNDRRIGIDIDPAPNVDDVMTADYLCWLPPKRKKYIVIGNPPFGLRGHLALQFVNHSAQFADVVGFILPQLFESDGKGVPSKRVLEYQLAFSQWLPPNSFVCRDGREIAINTVFQVWTKINTHRITKSKTPTCNTMIKIFSLSDGGTPASTRNKKMIGKCDLYIPSTCYKGMRAYLDFNDLPNQRGYGVVILKNKEEIKRLLLAHDWKKTSFYSTNSAMNLRVSLIKDIVCRGGFHD